MTPAPDGPGRWPQVATAIPNDPKLLQKVTPAASKTLKIQRRNPPKRHSKIRPPSPPAITSSIRQVLEESAAEAVACKSGRGSWSRRRPSVSPSQSVCKHASNITLKGGRLCRRPRELGSLSGSVSEPKTLQKNVSKSVPRSSKTGAPGSQKTTQNHKKWGLGGTRKKEHAPDVRLPAPGPLK